ncbi:MAG: hypothetical protein HFG40_00105 [Bacilli bacterium]|nr:hypothetical protein [Bacilli bacterium]
MKKSKLLLILLPLLLITGCSSYIELNQLGIVNLLGIDYKEDGYHLYISIIEGEKEDGTLSKNTTVYDATGDSLDQAFHHLYLKSNKKIYLSHMDALVLTEDAIQKRLSEIIPYLLSQKEIRNNFNLLQFQGKIDTLFDKKIESKEINELIKTNQQYMGTTHSITFEKFLEELLIDKNTYLPLISYQKELEIEGLSLIQNYKILGTLSPEDTILINILKNNINQAIYQNTTIYKNETNLKYKKNQITFSIHMEVNHQEKDLAKNLEQDMKRLLIYYQNQGYDLMKLEYRMHQNHLFSFRNKQTLLDQIKLKFELEIKTTDNYLERKLST